MRWKLALTLPALLLSATATITTAQVPVPLTMTMAADDVKPTVPVESVQFYWPADQQLGPTVTRPPTGSRYRQVVVGYLAPPFPPRVELDASYYIQNNPNPFAAHFEFDYQNTCSIPGVPNHIERIACSVQKRGPGVPAGGNDILVCTAFYAGMDNPMRECGSHSCIKCQRIEVCGADPACQ